MTKENTTSSMANATDDLVSFDSLIQQQQTDTDKNTDKNTRTKTNGNTSTETEVDPTIYVQEGLQTNKQLGNMLDYQLKCVYDKVNKCIRYKEMINLACLLTTHFYIVRVATFQLPVHFTMS